MTCKAESVAQAVLIGRSTWQQHWQPPRLQISKLNRVAQNRRHSKLGAIEPCVACPPGVSLPPASSHPKSIVGPPADPLSTYTRLSDNSRASSQHTLHSC